MAILLAYSTSGITSVRKFVATSKLRPFWKSWSMKHDLILTSVMKRSSQIMPPTHTHTKKKKKKKIFFVVMPSSMTSQVGLKSALYIHVWEKLASGNSGKDNISSIHANIVMVLLGYTCLKMISINNTFPRLQVKSQRHRLTGWPWYLNSVNPGIITMK